MKTTLLALRRHAGVVLVILISACAETPTRTTAFEPAELERIEALSLTLDEVGGDEARRNAVAELARRLLQDSGYSLAADDTETSWRLEAAVGTPRDDSPPAGFTLDIGDSDPRGTRYQKTRVVPASCDLVDTASGERVASYRGKRQAPGGAEAADTRVARYAHYVRSTCARLLTQLNVTRAAVAEIGDTFIPGIRIETLDPVTEQALATDKQAAPISTETVDSDSGRRRIQVFNQGDTLIIELGHQRR